MRKMLNISGERTLIAAITAPSSAHIDGIFSLIAKSNLPVIAWMYGVFAV